MKSGPSRVDGGKGFLYSETKFDGFVKNPSVGVLHPSVFARHVPLGAGRAIYEAIVPVIFCEIIKFLS
jgi:hypothetical protein